MAKQIIPVIAVSREVAERLLKSRANLVQKQVQVKTRHGTHSRMQWVRRENDVAGVGRGQIDLFAEPAAKPTASKADDYKIYHDSFTSVVDEVIGSLDRRGLYLDEEDVFANISSGPGKPKNGRTDRYNMPLYNKDGTPAKRSVHFQVYDMGNGKYELNLYTSPMKAGEYHEDKVTVRTPSIDSKPTDKSPFKVEAVDSHDDKEHGVRTELFKYIDGKNAGMYGVRVIDTDADKVVPSIRIYADEAKARAGFAEAAGIKKPTVAEPTMEQAQIARAMLRDMSREAAIEYAEKIAGRKAPMSADYAAVAEILKQGANKPSLDGTKVIPFLLMQEKMEKLYWSGIKSKAGRERTKAAEENIKKLERGEVPEEMVLVLNGLAGSYHREYDYYKDSGYGRYKGGGDDYTAIMREYAEKTGDMPGAYVDSSGWKKPEVKKSVFDLFRDGLAKAFGR